MSSSSFSVEGFSESLTNFILPGFPFFAIGGTLSLRWTDIVSGSKNCVILSVFFIFFPARYITSIPLLLATAAWILSPVTRVALYSFAVFLMILSLSLNVFGLLPTYSISIFPVSPAFLSRFNSSIPLNPLSLPMFAWCSSSATTTSGISTLLPLYSFLFTSFVILPSTITDVSGTRIIIMCLLLPLLRSILRLHLTSFKHYYHLLYTSYLYTSLGSNTLFSVILSLSPSSFLKKQL